HRSTVGSEHCRIETSGRTTNGTTIYHLLSELLHPLSDMVIRQDYPTESPTEFRPVAGVSTR
ncbi:MAG: hypothetical protein MI975_20355, partial [Cytophagales bacterium]|nr:hypothetical protein [Cytophagales bacterium]